MRSGPYPPPMAFSEQYGEDEGEFLDSLAPCDKNRARRGIVALATIRIVRSMLIQRILAPLASVLVLAVVSIRCLPFAFDDAYIHFRIAENFVAYGVPYFNASEAVMATSSPVWTCVLALLSLLPGALPVLTALINSVFTVLGAWVWSAILSQVVERNISRTTSSLFRLAYIGVLLPSSVGLMETPLAMLLLGWGALLLIHTRAAGWFFIALAIFTRYELVTFAILAAVAHIATTRKNILHSALLFCIPIALVSAFLVFFFSSPIPHTVTAKQIVYSLSPAQVLVDVFHNLVPRVDNPILVLPIASPLRVLVSALLEWIGMAGVLVFAAITCMTLPLPEMLSDTRQRWSLCIGSTGVLIGLAYIIKHVFLHEWYVPLFAVPVLLFAFAVSWRNSLTLVTAVTLSLLPLATVVEYSLAATGDASILRAAKPGARVQRYMQVGTALHELFPEARLMTSEIGGLGMSFRGTILDGVGLITPTALQYHPIPGSASGVGGIPAGLIREMKPELIVSYPVFLKDVENTDAVQEYVRLSMPAFSKEYRKILGTNGLWGCDTLLVYVRRDRADSATINSLKKALRARVESAVENG